MSDLVIETHGLTRYFGQKAAVLELNLHIPRGTVFGLRGRNGSGKSTTRRMLLGLIEPTRGSATILGHDVTRLTPECRARIGYMPEGHPVCGWMRVEEYGRIGHYDANLTYLNLLKQGKGALEIFVAYLGEYDDVLVLCPQF